MFCQILTILLVYLIKESALTCAKPGKSCLDCNTLQICDNNKQLKYKVTCRAQFPGKPYCNPSTYTCDSNQNVCNNVQTPFKCPGMGLYPDLTNCKRFFECPKEGQDGTLRVCLFQSVFNSAKRSCITGTACYSAINDCKGQYKVISYKPDPTKYVVCQGKDKPILKECKFRHLIFNEKTLTCDFKCPSEGTFKNSVNNTSFYICVRNGNILESYKLTCEPGEVFEEEYGTCVESLTTASSTVTTPSSETSTAEQTQSEGVTNQEATPKETTKNPNLDNTSSAPTTQKAPEITTSTSGTTTEDNNSGS